MTWTTSAAEQPAASSVVTRLPNVRLAWLAKSSAMISPLASLEMTPATCTKPSETAAGEYGMSRPPPAGLAGFQERVMGPERRCARGPAAPTASAVSAMATAMRQCAPKFSS